MTERSLIDSIANATLGIDTVWSGNVLSGSGTGRFIADCWFSDEPLPAAYTHEAAAPVRASGGLSAHVRDLTGNRDRVSFQFLRCAVGTSLPIRPGESKTN
jgi:hypothetical protein